MPRGEWLVPFKGRNASGVYNQNFLWPAGTVYVMDNHRAAMWCWLQHVDPGQPHSLFHMDRHYDCMPSPEWLENCPENIQKLSIDEYLNFDYAPNDFNHGERAQLFTWDNYLSIYLARYGNSINPLVMYTHDDDGAPSEVSFTRGDIWSAPGEIRCLGASHGPWIFNLDLDYFFWHDAEQLGLMVSDAYLEACFEKVREKIEDRTIAATTIALSPEHGLTGGWQPAERLAKRVLQILGVEFTLPQEKS
jgi:hypothetical protein